MAACNPTRTLGTLLATVALGAVVSLVSVNEARAVARACCLPNGTCEILTRTVCEDQQGGVSEMPGTDCSMVACPVLCSGSSPTCGGECPPSEICILQVNGSMGTTSLIGPGCECVPEIPAGGACDPQADACAPPLACINNICAAAPALAPALSAANLSVLVGALLALGALALHRRRHRS
jgi:MYXO-CTERM domain-containing protein